MVNDYRYGEIEVSIVKRRPLRILLIDDDEDSYVITRGLLARVSKLTDGSRCCVRIAR